MSEQVGLSVTFDGNTAGLEAAAKRANASLNSFKRSTGDATQSLMNLSRVAQDAPYGFMGIANNLNPLLESFQRLKVETGSTKSALSAMVAGLTGPAGMGLALGVVSSLVVSFGGKLFDSGEDAEEMTKQVNELTEALKSLSEEATRINNDFSRDFKVLLASLDAQGVGEQRMHEATLAALEAKRDRLQAQITRLGKTTNFIQSSPDFDLREFEEMKMLGTELKGIYAKFDAIRTESLKVEKEYYDNEAEIQIAGSKNAKRIREQEEKDREKALKELQANLKKRADAWNKYIEELKKAQDFLASFGRAQKSGAVADFSQVPSLNRPDITGNFLTGQLEAEEKGTDNLGILPSKEALDKMVADQKKAADDAAKVWEDFNRNIANVLANVRAELLVGLGEGLGEALGGNGIDSLATSMLNTVGSALTELGKQLIITSTAIKAFKEATKAAFAGNPVLGIAVGVGLTAIGSAMKARANKVKTFAQGGIVSTPTLGVFGEYAGAKNNPEVVAPLNKLKSLLGNSGGSDYLPMHRISGNELLLWYERSKGKQRRAY